jgi:uncharacterized DUF497 family protein
MVFQWDPKKARSNVAKHGVSFAHSVGALEDPRAITVDDPHPTEERYVTIGLDLLGRVVVVCWTPRGDAVRIISARRASKTELTDYEGNE